MEYTSTTSVSDFSTSTSASTTPIDDFTSTLDAFTSTLDTLTTLEDVFNDTYGDGNSSLGLIPRISPPPTTFPHHMLGFTAACAFIIAIIGASGEWRR